MFDATERRIRRTLRKLAKQRVAIILQPGNVLVIERALTPQDNQTRADLETCRARGWIEILHEGLPQGRLNQAGTLKTPLFEGHGNVWKLTSAGWSVINGTQVLALCALSISAMSFLLSVTAFARIIWFAR